MKKDEPTSLDKAAENNLQLEKQIKQIKERLDFLLAGECLSCGRYLIETIDLGFEEDDKRRDEWEI